MAGSSQDRPGLTQRGSGVKADPTYEDYLGLVKEISMLKVSRAGEMTQVDALIRSNGVE